MHTASLLVVPAPANEDIQIHKLECRKYRNSSCIGIRMGCGLGQDGHEGRCSGQSSPGTQPCTNAVMSNDCVYTGAMFVFCYPVRRCSWGLERRWQRARRCREEGDPAKGEERAQGSTTRLCPLPSISCGFVWTLGLSHRGWRRANIPR